MGRRLPSAPVPQYLRTDSGKLPKVSFFHWHHGQLYRFDSSAVAEDGAVLFRMVRDRLPGEPSPVILRA